MKRTTHSTMGLSLISRILALGLISASIFMAYMAAMAVLPDVGVRYCAPDSPAQNLTKLAGEGVPLPNSYGNGTRKPVTFTATMNTNRLFWTGARRGTDHRGPRT